ncbi:bud site selection protein 31 [Vigna unguiculata]|uniref:Bud site selection protein 31 n=1 Tax=Vigna unguiculata TaxID=3917 RepID=A0A4D6M8R6_VIGUN|nr:bud site selection protein 31 [Vigna unguiculata]
MTTHFPSYYDATLMILEGDCHDSSKHKHRCVTGGIYNYTMQLKAVDAGPSFELNLYKQVDHLLHYTKKKNNLGCNNRTKQHVISKELYEFCLDQGYADRNLIVKWKKHHLQHHLLPCNGLHDHRQTQVDRIYNHTHIKGTLSFDSIPHDEYLKIPLLPHLQATTCRIRAGSLLRWLSIRSKVRNVPRLPNSSAKYRRTIFLDPSVRATTRTLTPATLANLSHNSRISRVHPSSRAITQEMSF